MEEEEEEEEEEKEEEEEETLCRNAGLAHSLELNPESEVLNYSRIDTSLPTTLHFGITENQDSNKLLN